MRRARGADIGEGSGAWWAGVVKSLASAGGDDSEGVAINAKIKLDVTTRSEEGGAAYSPECGIAARFTGESSQTITGVRGRKYAGKGRTGQRESTR